MNAPAAGDRVSVTVFVAVSPEDAFDVFTREIDLWWKQGPKFRIAGRRRGQLHFEGGANGRLFETFEAQPGGALQTHEIGRITAWDPPARLEFVWRGVNFAPGESTTVDVRFEPIGRGTHVTVQHRGWSSLPEDHPVRHGQPPAEFIRSRGQWWGELMTSLREHSTRDAKRNG